MLLVSLFAIPLSLLLDFNMHSVIQLFFSFHTFVEHYFLSLLLCLVIIKDL